MLGRHPGGGRSSGRGRPPQGEDCRSRKSPRGTAEGGVELGRLEGHLRGGEKESRGRGLRVEGADLDLGLGGNGPGSGGVQNLL